MNILFVGDIFGKPGRSILTSTIESIRKDHAIDFTIVNGENAAGGFGITPDIAVELFDLGVDVITSGNHIWSKKEVCEYLDQNDKLLRPHNMPSDAPGKGVAIVPAQNGTPVAVINLIGRVFIGNAECPFQIALTAVDSIGQEAKVIFVDFHAEATSEKRALGWYLDGKVSAVVGTHTHVQTADEEILPKGTAYLTDVGMTGPHASVIGVEKEAIIERFLTQMPTRSRAAHDDVRLHGVVIEVDETTGQSQAIRRLCIRET